MAGRDGTMGDDYVSDDQLTLADEDERLPWLESGDDEDDEGGVDTGRIVGFALFAVLALAALVGGIWWFGNRGPDPELIADGSTIEAPAGPYKTAPADPGGKKFEGTGNRARGRRRARHRGPHRRRGAAAERRRAQAAPTAAPAATAPARRRRRPGRRLFEQGSGRGRLAAPAEPDRQAPGREPPGGPGPRRHRHRVPPAGGSRGRRRGQPLCTALKADGVACQVKQLAVSAHRLAALRLRARAVPCESAADDARDFQLLRPRADRRRARAVPRGRSGRLHPVRPQYRDARRKCAR